MRGREEGKRELEGWEGGSRREGRGRGKNKGRIGRRRRAGGGKVE